eukprot:Anaeramoba_ignava/a620874_4.p1 GENE.a620874_4~~a620874_4.p1  ORF type:complete len:207 (+),score=-12.44 a620874_4:41-661(+)
MKRKFAVLLTMILLSTAVFAEIELGMSMTPGEVLMSDNTYSAMTAIGYEGDTTTPLTGFHVGYSFWWLFYASFDSIIVPPWYIYQVTNSSSSAGINAPGYISFFDVGFRPRIGPIYLLATVGINDLYIHSYYADEYGYSDDGVGVNARIGVGLKLGAFGINITGTSVFNTFEDLTETVQGLIDQDPNATDAFIYSLIPSIGFSLHL